MHGYGTSCKIYCANYIKMYIPFYDFLEEKQLKQMSEQTMGLSQEGFYPRVLGVRQMKQLHSVRCLCTELLDSGFDLETALRKEI